MRLQRKLKKRIISVFGRDTYYGIVEGYLKIDKYHKNYGCHIRYTGKTMSSKTGFYIAGERHAYITFKNIY